MKKQISFISPGPTTKALVLVYLLVSVPILLLGSLVAYIQSKTFDVAITVTAILFNAILAFILLWIACHAYNWLASRIGGIEIVLTDATEEA
jgi:small basic protein